MKRYLLPERTYYKANLHAHTTVSDGGLTPAELKERYKAHGYSILAYTDHELLVDHSDLTDPEFLPITATEYAFVEKEDYFVSSTIELNLFAKDPHNVTQVCFDPKYVIHGEKWRAPIAKRIGGDFERDYTIEAMQQVIDTARENGFLVSLNHPQYSMESPEFFGKLRGLFAMEIYNHISFAGSGVYDYNPAMYDDMLRRGHRLYAIAADDCHGKMPDDSPRCDRYGGFTMIGAESLTYEKVMNALENGDFYASQGPLIESLYVEGEEVHLFCSPARSVSMGTSHRPFGGIVMGENGEAVTHATFKLPQNQEYIRFTVTDHQGRNANTRAYFL